MLSSLSGKHWLYSWIDEYEATSEDAAKARLAHPEAVSRLAQLARESTLSGAGDVPLVGSVLAGPGLDVGRNVCHSLLCRKHIFDYDIGFMLHYFDYIAMHGPDSKTYLSYLEGKTSRYTLAEFLSTVADDVGVMNYIRRIGLANYVVFVDKNLPCYCQNHFREYAEDAGLSELIEPGRIEEIAEKISRDGGISLRHSGSKQWGVVLTHPLFSDSIVHTFQQKTRPKKREVAAGVIRESLFFAVVETAVAKRLGTPLASVAQTDFIYQARKQTKMTPADVALNLNIPVLQGLPTAQLIRLREHEYDHFERFRQVLTEAITTSVEKSTSDSPAVVAETVWRDKLRPAMRDIERRIEASNRSLTRKIGTGIAVGAIASAVGTVAGFPLLAAAGATAAMTLPLPQVLKYFDDRQQIELGDMYFLWRAQRAHAHD
ncbi:hypothetical protein [Micromonospora sp. bgisy143]|uniref:hypothetical protein n=1 Tax=Micromonospora sp. bgisy143 TaxID=3413790 RepID=UPI003EBCC1CD